MLWNWVTVPCSPSLGCSLRPLASLFPSWKALLHTSCPLLWLIVTWSFSTTCGKQVIAELQTYFFPQLLAISRLAVIPTHSSVSLPTTPTLQWLSWSYLAPHLPFKTNHFTWELFVLHLGSSFEAEEVFPHLETPESSFVNESKPRAEFDKQGTCFAFSFQPLQIEVGQHSYANLPWGRPSLSQRRRRNANKGHRCR